MIIARDPSHRAAAAGGAAAVNALLLYCLLYGLAVALHAGPSRTAQPIVVTAEPPRPPPAPMTPQPRDRRDEGEGAPPALRAEPTEIVAPEPSIPLPPTPVAAAPLAGTGSDRSKGAAEVPGPGTGAGGIGDGPGRGRRGAGQGGGWHTPPRRTRGSLGDADYPAMVGAAGGGGTVSVQFSVETDGRVGRCFVTRSSGNAQLDEMTCRLIVQRYRFRPSLDGDGRPVRSQVVEDHSWTTVDDPEPPRARRRRF
jgi:periplasmic protein TonB